MRRVCCLALLLAASALADDKAIIEFRLKTNPAESLRGWMLELTERGFSFERFAGGRRFFVAWEEIVDEDRVRLRRLFKLDLSEDESQGLVAGHRLHFLGGGTVEGVLVRVDDEKRHWVRRGGFVLPYPGDRVARVEETKVKEIDVFGEEQIYLRRLERIPPRTARQHRDLADHMAELAYFKKAKKHYEAAFRLRPEWRAELGKKIAEIDLLMEDERMVRMLRRVGATYRLRHDYDRARADLKAFIEANPDRRRAALKVLDDLEARRRTHLLKRFHFVKNDEFRRSIDKFLRTRRPDLQEALSWATAKLPEDVKARVRERMGLTAKEVEDFLQTNAKGAFHWAGYWSGSFMFSKRATIGKTTKKTIRGDPDKWWTQYNDIKSRANFLAAYAAERLPDLFEVVEVRLRACEKCGGRGQVKHMSIRSLNAVDGGHEWWQRCPRCFGAKKDRSVAFR